MFKKAVLFFLFINSYNFCYMQQRYITPMSLGAECGPGLFPESVVIYRLLPVISFMKKFVLKKIAKSIVRQDNFKEIFNKIDESPFKMELRRQYYLFKNGEFIDNVNLSFSIAELFNAGLLNSRIKYAQKTGFLDFSNLNIDNLYGLTYILDNIARIITKLNLRNNNLTEITSNCFRYYLSELKLLDLSYNKITKLDANCFDSLLNIEFLNLEKNYLIVLPDDLFSSLLKLKKLDLSDNQLINLNSNSFFSLINLRFLNLADNKIINLPFNIFLSLKNLKELYLKGNNIKNDNWEKELKKINSKVRIFK